MIETEKLDETRLKLANKAMKLTVACGARSLSPSRSAA